MIHAIVHLVDDASLGGVNRMLEHMARSPDLARHATRATPRRAPHRARAAGQLRAPALTADIVVSHLSVSWSNLPLMTALRADYRRTPLVHVEHSYCERFVALNVGPRERFDTLLRTAYALFDRLVAVSPQQGARLERRRPVPPHRLSVSRPCVDPAPFHALEARETGDRIVVGALDRFDQQEGVDFLIEAFRQVPADRPVAPASLVTPPISSRRVRRSRDALSPGVVRARRPGGDDSRPGRATPPLPRARSLRPVPRRT